MHLFFFCIFGFVLLVPALAAEHIGGVAAVLDGDTVRVDGVRIRLEGIDAPEREQLCRHQGDAWPCGEMATAYLRRLIDGREVRCEVSGRDVYGRALASCYVGDLNLNAAMVLGGYALAFRRYSKEYIAQEGLAKKAGRGVWQGEFAMPWVWRAERRGH